VCALFTTPLLCGTVVWVAMLGVGVQTTAVRGCKYAAAQ
jgi:hypothetical protein